MDRPCSTAHLLYVTGKGGVGKTTVAASLGLAAAAARAAHDRLRGRRAGPRVARVRAPRACGASSEVAARREPVGDHHRPDRGARGVARRASSAAAALRLLTGSHAFQYFVAAAPGAKELITIAKVWELAQLERWDRRNRTYDLVIVDAPASGHGLAMLTTPRTFGEIARVGPIRRQAFKVRDMLADPRAHRLRRGRAARGDAGQRDARARRRGCAARSASGSTRSWSTASSRDRFTDEEAETLRTASADGRDPDARGAPGGRADRARARPGAARAPAPPARARRARRWLTLPFLFGGEMGLWATYATRLARKLGARGPVAG